MTTSCKQPLPLFGPEGLTIFLVFLTSCEQPLDIFFDHFKDFFGIIDAFLRSLSTYTIIPFLKYLPFPCTVLSTPLMAWGIEQIPHLNFILFIAELPYILPSAALTKNGTRILHSGHINAVSNFTWAFRTEKSCTHLGPSWSTFHAEVHIFRSYGRTDKLVFGKNIRSRPWHFGRFPPFLGTEILLNKVDITLNLESVDLKRLDITLKFF